MWTQVGKGKVRRTKKVALIHIHTHTHPFVVQSLSCAWLSATPETASTSGIPVLHHLLEVAQIHVCRVGDAVNYHVQNRWLVGSYSTAQGALWWPGGAGGREVQEEGDICRHSVCVCVKLLVTQFCPTLCDPMNYSPPGSSVHGILQARILEWVAFPFSRRSSQPRDWTQVTCIAGRLFTVWAPNTYVLKPLINISDSHCCRAETSTPL